MLESILISPFTVMILWGITLLTQWKVTRVIRHYHEVQNTHGITGRDLAEKMLKMKGIHNVTVQQGEGMWVADFYDPTNKLVNLSPEVYHNTSISALSIAAHEVGHAMQDHEAYGPLRIRGLMYPLANISSYIAPVLIIAGLFLQMTALFTLGIYFFAGSTIFTLMNLPVEFDASNRAKAWLTSNGYVSSSEAKSVDNLLFWAAMTYVMAALMSVAELARFFLMARNQD